MPSKIVVVTGGVISGLGKGITASSLGLLLKDRGFSTTAIKIDPYLNIDAGTMSPQEHGECFVLGDGGEVDLDLGNYERFLDVDLTKDHSITTGKVYSTVINKERKGDYLGKTVQIVPHVTDEIKSTINKIAGSKKVDVTVIEVGGTIGDIETAPFIEALRQMSFDTDNYQFCFLHVSMIINSGEQKTKPTQHSVSQLRSLGISPDILIMRTGTELKENVKKKLSTFCQIKVENIISNTDVKNIYFVPQVFNEQKLVEKVATVLDLNLDGTKSSLSDKYTTIIKHFNSQLPKKTIVIAGKYVDSNDSYLSLVRAIEHASFSVGVHTNIIWLNTEDLDISGLTVLKTCDAVIIPGGFGIRGVAGKILVAEYCRRNNIPTLGICYGMQIMIVEFARSLGLDCGSTEWDESTKNPIIYILPNQTDVKGGTMRLGNYETTILPGTKTAEIYKSVSTIERHRHRYEFNNKYKSLLESNKMIISGICGDQNLAEIIELKDHVFYVGCQFHPEFKSRNSAPHQLFVALLKNLKL